jgi:hypothetical protein
MLPAQNIHGLWSGTLVNDSMHRTQNFELGLSEYRGKITGYTYTTFIENDTFYYSVKRIRAERKDGKLIIEDVEMVGNNFPEKASKHVKQTTTFPLINDSTIDISNGSWTTNQTKKYYSIHGSAKIKEQQDEKESDLLAHLQEMKVKNDIAVNQKEKKKDVAFAKNPPPTNPKQDNKNKNSEIKNTSVVTNSPAIKPQQNNSDKVPGIKKDDVAKNQQVTPSEIKPVSEINYDQKTEEAKSSIKDSEKPNIISANSNETKENKLPQTAVIKQQPVANNSVKQNVPVNSNTVSSPQNKSVQTQITEQRQATARPVIQKNDQSINSSKSDEPKINPVTLNMPVSQKKETIEAIKELPAIVASRKNEAMQNIYFKNDSLILSLYDNGIVDGDTVSVFLNGENIISKQKLKESATKKTIYISERSDSVELVLFAENLGTIPPNTGLLTIRDGDDIYQVRFSADLQKNATIVLRRKKDQ